MTPLEKMAEAYWNAFRDGFIRVGGDAQEYPVWSSGPNHVRLETLRCLRHAVDVIRFDFDGDKETGPFFSDVFPEPCAPRSAARTINDDLQAEKLR